MKTTRSNTMGLRAYQMKSLHDIHAGFKEYNSQLAVIPTGGGNTIVFSRLAVGRVVDTAPRPALGLTHCQRMRSAVAPDSRPPFDPTRTRPGVRWLAWSGFG